MADPIDLHLDSHPFSIDRHYLLKEPTWLATQLLKSSDSFCQIDVRLYNRIGGKIMDAFLKCLLACVVSLLPVGINGNSGDSPRMRSDTEITECFLLNREKYEDLALEFLIENNSPATDFQSSKSADLATLTAHMRSLGVSKVSVGNNRMAFMVDENGTATKELIFQPYWFTNYTKTRSDRNLQISDYSKIDNDWGLSYAVRTNSQ
jgi:hypothetical protein